MYLYVDPIIHISLHYEIKFMNLTVMFEAVVQNKIFYPYKTEPVVFGSDVTRTMLVCGVFP